MKVEFALQKKMISTIIVRIWTRISNSVTLVATNSPTHSFFIAQVIKVDRVMRFFKIKLSFPSFSALKRNMIATLKYTGAYLNSSWMHILVIFVSYLLSELSLKPKRGSPLSPAPNIAFCNFILLTSAKESGLNVIPRQWVCPWMQHTRPSASIETMLPFSVVRNKKIWKYAKEGTAINIRRWLQETGSCLGIVTMRLYRRRPSKKSCL